MAISFYFDFVRFFHLPLPMLQKMGALYISAPAIFPIYLICSQFPSLEFDNKGEESQVASLLILNNQVVPP